MASLQENKENIGGNPQRDKSTLIMPIKAVMGEKGADVRGDGATQDEKIDDVGATDEEVKLPLDDFSINGINATKEVDMTTLAVICPPDRISKNDLGTPFSPDLNVSKYKNDLKKLHGEKVRGRALQPIPHVLNCAEHSHRNDTLSSTWDKKKSKMQKESVEEV